MALIPGPSPAGTLRRRRGEIAPVGDGEAEGVFALADEGVGPLVGQLEVQKREEGAQPALPDGGDIPLVNLPGDGVPALAEEFPGRGDGVFQFPGRGGLLPGQGKGSRFHRRVPELRLADGFYEVMG